MKSKTGSIEDIKAIRKIMEESTRFLSLSGLSGVFAGLAAIAGAFVAYIFILDNGSIGYEDYLKCLTGRDSQAIRWKLMADAVIVLIVSVLTAFLFSIRKARIEGKRIWSPVSGRLLFNLLVPLVAGGVFIVALVYQNNLGLVIPCFLIFYGLALVNAGKFTAGEVFYLGLLEIITGLSSAFFPGRGLIFWIFGFGVLHIIYGLVMFRKYGA